MGKIYLFIFIFCISVNLFSSESISSTNRPLVNKTVSIASFVNVMNDKNYDFLKSAFPDSIRTSLRKTKKFKLISNDQVRKKIIKHNFDTKKIFEEENALKLGIELKTDVIIVGKFITLKDRIRISIIAVDIEKKKTKVSIEKTSDLSTDIFNAIDNIVNEFTERAVKEFPPEPQKIKVVKVPKKWSRLQGFHFYAYTFGGTIITVGGEYGFFDYLIAGISIGYMNFGVFPDSLSTSNIFPFALNLKIPATIIKNKLFLYLSLSLAFVAGDKISFQFLVIPKVGIEFSPIEFLSTFIECHVFAVKNVVNFDGFWD